MLVARREERLRALAAELNAEYEVCDVSDRQAVGRMAEAVRARHPAVDLLVNNAGIPGRWSFTQIPEERLEEVLLTTTSGRSGACGRCCPR